MTCVRVIMAVFYAWYGYCKIEGVTEKTCRTL